ncbi:hypothetical protein SDJN02_25141 [Cucurbita argyrosperma subsp. argyrosperma]|nr:hypothetical protein SDJN02_25141 [Cucurbita argyrosperma subsp. argyrosperma]
MANCSDEEQPTTPSPHYDNDVNDDECHPNSDAAAADEAQHEGEEPYAIPNPTVEREAFILCEVNRNRVCIPLKVRLHQAALKGDWKTAKSIFDIDSSAITMKITDADETALHIAVAAKHIHFVENLVDLTSSSALAATSGEGYTALAFAAASGVVRMAKVMVDKNSHLPNLHDLYIPTPVLMAIKLLIATISSDYYDMALEILNKKLELARERLQNGDTALHVLARKPSMIGSNTKLSFWKTSINSRFPKIYHTALMQTLAHQIVERLWNFVLGKSTMPELHEFIKHPTRLLHDAARVGNVEFLIILIRSYPNLLWKCDPNKLL